MFIIFLICIGILVCLFIGWWIELPCGATKIKFDAFKQFYAINQQRWELGDNYVTCIIDDDSHRWFSTKRENFYFGFFDYQKYKRFHANIKRNRITDGNMRATSEMLKMVKKDISNMESLAKQQQKQAMNNLNSILNNLGGVK